MDFFNNFELFGFLGINFKSEIYQCVQELKILVSNVAILNPAVESCDDATDDTEQTELTDSLSEKSIREKLSTFKFILKSM